MMREIHTAILYCTALEATQKEGKYINILSPNLNCVIKYKWNRLLHKYGDSEITNGSGSFVDHTLKFSHNIPLIINANV